MNQLVKIEDFKGSKTPKPIGANQAYYGARVDYNLRNISSQGCAYIIELLDNLFKTVVQSNLKHTDAGFYIRVEREAEKMSLLECSALLRIIDEYLARPHLEHSKEREFFMRIRNICFMRLYQFHKKKSG